MNRIIAIAVCCMLIWGCAMQSSIPHLSDAEYQKLVAAGNDIALKNQPVQEAIQKLKPIEVYYHIGNVVIALKRDAHEERGFYIVPMVSSYDPRFGMERGWTLKPLAINNAYSTEIYEYSRER